jgi:hypothetical protein
MKFFIVTLLVLTSCQRVVDSQIQKQQSQQLDFEKADQEFSKTFNDFS